MKIIGLSVDSTADHDGVDPGHRGRAGASPNYPIIGDDFNVSKLYGMLPAGTTGEPRKRTPADNQTVRDVFGIAPTRRSS